mgnify:CR=1 FL=1
MAYKYKHFISQNTAPSGAKSIGVYDEKNNRVCTIPLGRLTPPNTEPLYSFGLLADIHLMANSNGGTAVNDSNGFGRYPNGTKFNKILTFFENQGTSFCCVAGDLTNIGLCKSDKATFYADQFAEYKHIRELHPNLPVYGICGNHESYYKNITENLTELETYSGHGLTYTVTQDNDLFIFIGQNTPQTPMTDEALSWLETTLETNKNKRCFVFVHSVVDDNDSGTRFGYYSNMTFDWWGEKKTTFINIMKKYQNAILFHGHTHMSFEAQTIVNNIIYSTSLGFKSVHIPSIYAVRIPDTVNEKLKEAEGAEGYIVDVYEDFIVLNGYEFAEPNYDTLPVYSGTSWNETPVIVPLGVYKIDI